MAFVSEEDNMLALCELHRNTLVVPQDRGAISQFIAQRDAGVDFLVPPAEGQELRRIWDYVEPQT